VHSLETQAGFASRDKEAAVEALSALRTEHDTLLSQQTQWEDLRRTTEQLEHLSALVTQAQTNEPELKELRRVRDRSKVLEGEYAALQRRYKEQETRSTSSDRAASSARASLAQAQQRATEWEERANEHESALSEAQAAREDAEDRMVQLAEDYALVKIQLDEKDAEERLAKVRSSLFFLAYQALMSIV
jgi:chromosome segregation ATPase